LDRVLAAAEADIQAGRRDEAIAKLKSLTVNDARAPLDAHVTLLRQLTLAGRTDEGLALVGAALAAYPDSPALWNLNGALLRQARRLPQALASFERALALDADAQPPAINRGSTLLDLGDFGHAAEVFESLVATGPNDAGLRLQYGRSLAGLGRASEAEVQVRAAVGLRPDYADAWRLLASFAADTGDHLGAEAVLNEGLRHLPDNSELLAAKVALIRDAEDLGRAEATLRELLPRLHGLAWIHAELGDLVSTRDRPSGTAMLRHAVDLDPSVNHVALLIQCLVRSIGPDEGANLDEAYALSQRVLTAGELGPGHTSILFDLFQKVVALDDLARLGDLVTLGRSWAESGRHGALFRLIGCVRTPEDRRALVELHRSWRVGMQAKAERSPIRRPPSARTPRSPIRVGFMSSDLRRHAVGYFALPLFDHFDRSRFEVYGYSYYQGAEDDVQAHFARQATHYRWIPHTTAREAAQIIADDQLDVLIELGGSTQMNRLGVMAWRPAPLQASWLGYPHSSGLETIDGFICDRFNLPSEAGLLLERPIVLPRSWIALGELAFTDDPPVSTNLPEDSAGFLTYGTANSPHKYTRDTLRLWARVTAATPGSRFAFLRPEAGSAVFRRHVLREFAEEGVAEERVLFWPVRWTHLEHYGRIDITLDSFPLTGGTTTVESLWMGVPVVSLKGPAFYERLSHSILSNVGLPDLVADDEASFLRVALSLAADHGRRTELRRSLRDRVKASPLGQPEAFTREFFQAIEDELGRTRRNPDVRSDG
jgi:tetratricopeptide (TPR) repeat protein